MKPILMAPRMAIALRNTKIDSWPAEPIDQTKPFKWQTRRAVNRLNSFGQITEFPESETGFCFRDHRMLWNDLHLNEVLEACPYGRPGELLYVKENYKYYGWTDDGIPHIEYTGGSILPKKPDSHEWALKIMGIWADLSAPDNYAIDGRASDRKWRPSIHMPRWASRTHLKLEGIRIERLRDISESDAIAEGFESREEFLRYYAERNKKSPDENPWVWVLEFRRIA